MLLRFRPLQWILAPGAGEGASGLVVTRQQHAPRVLPATAALTGTPSYQERVAAAHERGTGKAPEWRFAVTVKALAPFLARLKLLASRLVRKEPGSAKHGVAASEWHRSWQSGRPPGLRQLDQHSPAEVADSRAPEVGFDYAYNDEPSRIVSETDVYAAGTVVLSETSSQTVTVDYATQSGLDTRFNPRGYQPAQAGADYIATSGTLTFMPGETVKRYLCQ